MKHISKLFIAVGLFAGAAFAQNTTTNASKLELTAWVSDQIEGMPDASKKNLENKLGQILTQNGLAGTPNTRFVLTANVLVQNKEITPSAPPMQLYTLNITFYIGDGIEGKGFSTYSTEVKGAGENETKAYQNALKNIKVSDPAYQSFIEKGKAKIVDYYETQCDLIIKEAKQLATMRKYDEAVWKLTSVPSICTTCWDKSVAALAPIYQEKLDFECQQKLAEATSIWNADMSWNGAEKVGAVLKTVDPKAACYKDVKAFEAKVAERIKEVDKREWNVTYEKAVGLQKDAIEAYKEVGTAYGKNQPQNVSYKTMW